MLNSCYYCGTNIFVQVVTTPRSSGIFYESSYCECLSCGMRGPKTTTIDTSMSTAPAAIELWNRLPLAAANLTLLKSAYYALRSYQYGNQSPELAGEVADTIMEAAVEIL